VNLEEFSVMCLIRVRTCEDNKRFFDRVLYRSGESPVGDAALNISSERAKNASKVVVVGEAEKEAAGLSG